MMLVVIELWYLTLPLMKASKGRLGRRRSYIAPTTTLRFGALNIGAPPRSWTPPVSPGNAGKHLSFFPASEPFAAKIVVPTRTLLGSVYQAAAFHSRMLASGLAKRAVTRCS